jgi:phosphomannomutase
MTKIPCFKAYDVRGRVPEELNEDLAYRIGQAYAAFLSPVRVAWGGMYGFPACRSQRC